MEIAGFNLNKMLYICDVLNTKKGFKYFLFITFADELANKATNGPNNSLLSQTKNKMTSDMYIA